MGASARGVRHPLLEHETRHALAAAGADRGRNDRHDHDPPQGKDTSGEGTAEQGRPGSSGSASGSSASAGSWDGTPLRGTVRFQARARSKGGTSEASLALAKIRSRNRLGLSRNRSRGNLHAGDAGGGASDERLSRSTLGDRAPGARSRSRYDASQRKMELSASHGDPVVLAIDGDDVAAMDRGRRSTEHVTFAGEASPRMGELLAPALSPILAPGARESGSATTTPGVSPMVSSARLSPNMSSGTLGGSVGSPAWLDQPTALPPITGGDDDPGAGGGVSFLPPPSSGRGQISRVSSLISVGSNGKGVDYEMSVANCGCRSRCRSPSPHHPVRHACDCLVRSLIRV